MSKDKVLPLKLEWRTIGLVVGGLAIALLATWLSGSFIPYPTADNLPTRWDHYRYIAMSQHPFDPNDALAREAPYCWRILTPLLVYLSPLDWRISFMALALIGLGGAALTLYAYLRHLGYSEAVAWFGLALFFSLGGLIVNIRDFYLGDPLALFAIALVFYWLGGPTKTPAVERPAVPVGWLLVVMLLGVTAKETVLAVLPLLILSPRLNVKSKLWLSLAPVALVVALRLIFPSSNQYNYMDELQDVVSNKFWGEGWLSLLERINFAGLGTWGPVLVLVLYQPRETWRYVKQRKTEMLYLVIIYGQLVIAHNVDRLLVYGFVVMIPLLVEKAFRLATERHLNIYGLIAVGLALQLIYFYSRPPLWLSLGICGLILIWLWGGQLPKSRTGRLEHPRQ